MYKCSLKNKDLRQKVWTFKGDITKLQVDAIVNPTDIFLHGGEVGCAIHQAAGPLLKLECRRISMCPIGQARITRAYNLPCKYIIHTASPYDGSLPYLQSCYESSLAYQKLYNLSSIAFPCISTGRNRFHNRLAAHIALATVRNFLESNERLERVIFCTFMPIDVDIYEALMPQYFPVHDENNDDL